ncbi:MAG: TonB-dependent receptor [Melioribacteraceae bacterium]|nr:TonB-dependent receptor [Melioribacteraceae bacterium]
MKLHLLIIIVAIFSSNIFAQTDDSVKVYDLNEITVKGGSIIEPKPTTRIGSQVLTKYDGVSLFEIARFIPSLKPQTNSRGESLFYLRGSNERQLGLFFDGALLNIPWDNRIDLSLLPTNDYEELQIIKGIPSSIYGANNIAGVVVGKSKLIKNDKLSGKFNSLFGENNFRKFNLSMYQKINDFSFLISASHFKRDGFSLPSEFSSDENPDKLRLNSYQRTYGIYTKGRYDYQDFSNVEISLQYLDSKKDVPPEINVNKTRYWKYPVWNKIGANISGTHNFNFNSTAFLDYNFNIYKFKMEINQYTDAAYSTIDDIEKNDDFVIYGRVIYTLLFNQNSILRLSSSGYSTTHTEKFLCTQFAKTDYQQFVYSAGAEYELLGNGFIFIGGVSYDGTSVVEAGNFKTGNPLSALGVNTTLKYNFTNYFNGQINLGRKSRFPSLRESYSDGLGRFVINPDLKAETADDVELGFEYLLPEGRLFVNFLLTYLYDGIVRTVVPTNDGNRFMRINEDQIRTYGAEIEGNYDLGKHLNFGFSFSYLNSFGKNDFGKYSDTLEYRPGVISNLYLNSNLTQNINLLLEATSIANEYGLQDGNPYFQKIPSYLIINFRFAYTYHPFQNNKIELFARVNNIFDRIYYTQFGLPEAGREFFVGLNYIF